MATTTLPTFTKTIDNAFTTTWYQIQAQAADNILNSTVIWAMLKMKGCFKPQSGGTNIERTVKYALPTTKAVVKGDILGAGEIENRTAAFWTFRNLSIHIQRSLFDDRANRGQFKIVDYVSDRLEDASDSLRQQYESDILRAAVTDESGKELQGLNDMIPTSANRATGTYGGINRPTTYASDLPTVGNIWWSPRYLQLTANPEVNLLSNMKVFYNTVSNNQEAADVIVTSKNLYELYQDFGLDQTQLLGNQRLLDLGFTSAKYNGSDIIWTSNMSVDDMLFLNTRWIDVVYDPGMYFEMTPWQTIPGQVERIAYIICTMNIVSKQLRRHGRLYT